MKVVTRTLKIANSSRAARRWHISSATRVSTPAPLSETDMCVKALKVLASSLLRQINYLEQPDQYKNTGEVSLKDEVCRFEAELIRSALRLTGGRQRRAAQLLGTKLTTLNTKIRKYDIRIDNSWEGNDDVEQ